MVQQTSRHSHCESPPGYLIQGSRIRSVRRPILFSERYVRTLTYSILAYYVNSVFRPFLQHKAITNVLWWKMPYALLNSAVFKWRQKRMLIKISLERLLAESSRLQDHRQRNCVIRSVTVYRARYYQVTT